MANTPLFAFPYPLGTDRVMDGDDVIHNLALAVEAQLSGTGAQVSSPYRSAAGATLVNASVPGNNGVASTATFPAGRFTVTPIGVCSGNSNGYGFAMFLPTSTTAATVRYYNPTASTHTNAYCHWYAVQMLTGVAPGLLAAPVESNAIATCHTGECGNDGIPLEIYIDPDSSAVVCGVCDVVISDLVPIVGTRDAIPSDRLAELVAATRGKD